MTGFGSWTSWGGGQSIILFDSVAGNSGGNGSTSTTSLVIPVNIVSGETGFLSIFVLATNTVSSVVGGGTWTLIKSQTDGNGYQTQLWSNGASGGSSSASVTVNVSVLGYVYATVVQYKNILAILSGGAQVAMGTSANPSLAFTTTVSNSWVVSSFATFLPVTGPLYGVIRITDSLYSTIVDNTYGSGTGSVLLGVTAALGVWSVAAVEVTPITV